MGKWGKGGKGALKSFKKAAKKAEQDIRKARDALLAEEAKEDEAVADTTVAGTSEVAASAPSINIGGVDYVAIDGAIASLPGVIRIGTQAYLPMNVITLAQAKVVDEEGATSAPTVAAPDTPAAVVTVSGGGEVEVMGDDVAAPD